ncbi:hypothetical protein Tco_1482793 [Tanacetum coccineum]|uniref:Uncharacterized protein n=1 Tax=Tanacetum coccineum TaxID=301880 RepID=A0ABQ5AWM1_9ASTR
MGGVRRPGDHQRDGAGTPVERIRDKAARKPRIACERTKADGDTEGGWQRTKGVGESAAGQRRERTGQTPENSNRDKTVEKRAEAPRENPRINRSPAGALGSSAGRTGPEGAAPSRANGGTTRGKHDGSSRKRNTEGRADGGPEGEPGARESGGRSAGEREGAARDQYDLGERAEVEGGGGAAQGVWGEETRAAEEEPQEGTERARACGARPGRRDGRLVLSRWGGGGVEVVAGRVGGEGEVTGGRDARRGRKGAAEGRGPASGGEKGGFAGCMGGRGETGSGTCWWERSQRDMGLGLRSRSRAYCRTLVAARYSIGGRPAHGIYVVKKLPKCVGAPERRPVRRRTVNGTADIRGVRRGERKGRAEGKEQYAKAVGAAEGDRRMTERQKR